MINSIGPDGDPSIIRRHIAGLSNLPDLVFRLEAVLMEAVVARKRCRSLSGFSRLWHVSEPKVALCLKKMAQDLLTWSQGFVSQSVASQFKSRLILLVRRYEEQVDKRMYSNEALRSSIGNQLESVAGHVGHAVIGQELRNIYENRILRFAIRFN